MVIKTPSYSPGSLVQARDRNWVVLPADEEDVVIVWPVDGSDEDSIGIFLPIERDSISPSEYDWPEPDQAGNFQGGLLLRDAVRLTLRSVAGPFRSLGRLSVVPRPYQYVPLIMALRQDPVRFLVADDVGVGKTIEAGMTKDPDVARKRGDLAEGEVLRCGSPAALGPGAGATPSGVHLVRT